ncbi:HNH endonuclease family protein [Pseudokineococcus lusitanus]|uniref:HNH endonuclease family protein n=1 Tax=Pseudokineococcus lusitanus TaxID=763993 RepID=UPI000F4739E8|nr:HNH endonuclease family protein [Pseudokineococcus lusitanus]
MVVLLRRLDAAGVEGAGAAVEAAPLSSSVGQKAESRVVGRSARRSSEQAAARDRLVDTLGNLTLVSQKLNASLSNRPWRDDEAQCRDGGGQLAGKGKRSLLQQWSLLALNNELTSGHPEAWTDDDIRRRGQQLAELACRCWPRPAGEPSRG